jgi:ureidoacrylate peracid hydrolase
MNKTQIPPFAEERVRTKLGRLHPYDTIHPAATALVVVDMQNYFVKAGMPGCCLHARDVVVPNNRLAHAVREAGGRVIWIVTEALPERAADWPNFYALASPDYRERRIRELAPGAEGHALCADLDVREEDSVVTKLRYSAFIQPSSGLDAHLAESGVDTILVTGVATNVCCETTARDAMMLGYRTIMVSDALAAFTDEEHNAALTNFYLFFGDVQTTDEVIGRLLAGRRTPA